MTVTARRARANDDRVRDRWLAGPDRRRVHLRCRASLRRRRRPVRRRSRRDGQGRGHRLRPPLRLRALRGGGRRGPPGAGHPGGVRRARGPDPDELVRGRRARRGCRHRHHGQPQPVGRQRVQGQGADRFRGRTRDPQGRSRPSSRSTAGPPSTGGRSPRPRRPGTSSDSTRTRATSASSGGRSTSTRSRRPTSRILVDPMWGAGAAGSRGCWPAAGSGSTRSTRSATRTSVASTPSPSGRTSTRPSGCSPAAATTWACSSTATPTEPARPTSSGTFIHQLEVTGLLMYYLAEHRGLRDPVVISVNNTSMAARLGEHYGITTYETPVGFKYIGPKMIETGAMMGAEESGGFGFGMHLPERDGVYADLLLLDLFLRERAAGRWPVSKAIAHFHELAGPSFYRRVDVHVERSRLRRDEAATAGRPRATSRRPSWPASRSPGPMPLDTERRLQVLPRRRVVAARSGRRARSRSCGSTPRPRRGGARDAMLAAGERLVRGRDRRDGCGGPARGPPGRQALGPRADLGRTPTATSARSWSSRRAGGCRSSTTSVKDESILVLQRPAAADLEDDDGDDRASRSSAGRAPPRPDRPDPPLRGHRALRARSRSRRPSSTTSSGSRTTSAARGRARPVAGAVARAPDLPRTIRG